MASKGKIGFANGVSNQAVCRVTFGGIGDKPLIEVIDALRVRIEESNVTGWHISGSLDATPEAKKRYKLMVLPDFLEQRRWMASLNRQMQDFNSPRCAKSFIRNSAFHTEIIGYDFGEGAFALAQASYIMAKGFKIPTLVLVKSGIEYSAHEKPLYGHAERFLRLVDKDDIAMYSNGLGIAARYAHMAGKYSAFEQFQNKFMEEYKKYLREV